MSDASSVKISDLVPPLTIETLVNGGAGLARYAGRVVFIPHVAVGDIVSCRVTRIKKSFLEAEICEVVQPSPVRQQPVCPVAGECGGCQWQHLPYSEQLHWKESLFRESLVRQCHIDSAKVLPILTAPQEWNYRSRIQIKCEKRGDTFVTGFFRPRSHDIVAIDHCPLIASELNNLLYSFRQLFDNSAYAAHISQIDLMVDDRKKSAAVIHYAGDKISALVETIEAASLPADILLQTETRHKLMPVTGHGTLTIEVDDPSIPLDYSAGSFAQINLEQNRRMVKNVIDLASLSGAETVVDLFCGMGNFSLPLAKRVGQVVGVEASKSSIKMANKNCRRQNIKNATFYNRSAVGALTFFLQQRPVDLVVLDPPRSGAIEVMKELIDRPIKRIIYVSCDPQTLTRDLKILVKGGYELVSSQPVDMFPQTHHCESITLLQRP